MIDKCLNCGSENLESGQLMSRSAITYISAQDAGSIFRKDQDVTCFRCINCGLIMPFVWKDIS